ncbi:MAG: helix-turn-helix transcriptional regulator [Anaerolineaceae bacterium]|nr:helix-turn-helix transcriptional regulator [Anaerolineaceae bacterium]
MRNFGQGKGPGNPHGVPGGRGRGRFRSRLMEPVILLALKKQPAHGYTLLAELENFGLGNLDPSMLYRLLRDMEARELVTSAWDEEQSQGPPRRTYQITPQGESTCELWQQHLTHQRDMLQAILDTF